MDCLVDESAILSFIRGVEMSLGNPPPKLKKKNGKLVAALCNNGHHKLCNNPWNLCECDCHLNIETVILNNTGCVIITCKHKTK